MTVKYTEIKSERLNANKNKNQHLTLENDTLPGQNFINKDMPSFVNSPCIMPILLNSASGQASAGINLSNLQNHPGF